MDDQAEDQPVLNHIQLLASEEHRLYSQGARTKAEEKRLATIRVKLDQCWDLLCQRRALRDVGEDPNEAQVRPPEVVEKYEQQRFDISGHALRRPKSVSRQRGSPQ